MTNLREQMKAMGLHEELEDADRDAVMEIADQASSDRERMARAERELAEARAEVERLETEMRERLSFTLDDGQAKIHGKPKDLLAVVELREQAEQQKALLADCLALLAESEDSECWGIRSANVREKLRAALGQQQKGAPE